jgi:hypothetical protein
MRKLIAAATLALLISPAIAQAAIQSTGWISPGYVRFGEVFGTTLDSILLRLPDNTTVAACDGNPGAPGIQSAVYVDASSDPLRSEKADAYLQAVLFTRDVNISYDDVTCDVAAVWVR